MVKLSEVFGVIPDGVIDLDLDSDQALYVEPLLLDQVDDPDFDAEDADLRMSMFMGGADSLLDDPAKQQHLSRLLKGPHELNETRLGLGAGKPQGNATSEPMLTQVLLTMRQIEGLEVDKHPEGLLTFTPRFGEDRYSDLCTNIMAADLIQFTQRKCRRYEIPITPGHRIVVFNPVMLEWETLIEELPTYNGLGIIFVPEALLVDGYPYTAQEYVNFEILEGRKAFYKRRGHKINKREILKLETAEIMHDKFKIYALQEAVREPARYLEYLKKRRMLG